VGAFAISSSSSSSSSSTSSVSEQMILTRDANADERGNVQLGQKGMFAADLNRFAAVLHTRLHACKKFVGFLMGPRLLEFASA
jgi:hypothetical protein